MDTDDGRRFTLRSRWGHGAAAHPQLAAVLERSRADYERLLAEIEQHRDVLSSFKQEHDPKNPLISPLHGDYKGLPPMLIHVGDAEILLDDSTRVAERAKKAGVKVELEAWPEMFHVWHVFAKILPEGQQAIDRIGEYILAHASPSDQHGHSSPGLPQ